MANNNVQTTVTVGMDVQLAKRNAEALKQVISDLRSQLKLAREAMDSAANVEAFKKAGEAVDNLILKIKTLEKVQKSATPASAYEAFISGDAMNSNTLRQAQRGAKNRLNTVRTGEGDTEARKFIQDTNAIQKQLNRLQAGFTSPFRTIKQELKSLSGGELQRLHQLLQQEQPLVKGNEKAWANYSAAIAKVDERMREYDTLARQQMGAATLSQSQRGGFAAANERDINRAIEKLREYRAVINDPNGSGKATWEATTREILKLQATLDGLKAKADEASGKAMSLGDALHIGTQAAKGTFVGSTKNLALAKKTLQEQLELVERNSTAYKQLQKAIQGVEMEEKRMGMTAKEVKAVLDSPKGKSFNELKIAVEQGRMELARMRTDTKEGKKAFDELAAKVKEADLQMKQLGNSSKGTASAFDKAWSRLKTYVGLYVGAAVAMQKIAGTLRDLMELSDKMGEVRKTTGFTADEVGRLTENLKQLDTRSSITSLLGLSVAAGQLGLKTEEDVRGFTEAANMLMVALPEMGQDGATQMLKVALATGEIDKIRKEMQAGLIDGASATAVALTKIGSTIDQLRANSAAAAPAITDFVKRVGAVGAQSGISIDQIAALGSTVDALGMRVEMSATALSRMIPAIKNNAFDIAKAIGVAPETVRTLFDTGRGMEAILMILQHIKDSGADEDGIEKMLGMGGLGDIMKDLNQQGARAGIVFAGLSQNVDELRRQLGVAASAYEENIAIQEEYNKMNDTTAAKWERLKNQLEEAFVGDASQRFLGSIIDGLRKIVDLLTGSGGLSIALRTIIAYISLVRLQLAGIAVGLLKSLWTGIKNIGVAIGFVKGEMTKLQMANIFTAAAAAALLLWQQLRDTSTAISAVSKAIAKLEENFRKEVRAVNELFCAVNKTNVVLEKAKKQLEEVSKAGNDTTEAENKLKKANADHAATIREINSKYGDYLGYMLSETASAEQLARARELINAKLRETITLKQREAALESVEQEFGGRVNKKAASIEELVQSYFGDNYDAAARVSVAISEAAEKYAKDAEGFRKAVHKIIEDNLKFISQEAKAAMLKRAAREGTTLSDEEIVRSAVWHGISKRAEEYRKAMEELLKQEEAVNHRFEAQQNLARKDSREKAFRALNATMKDWNRLLSEYQKAEGEEKAKLAAEVYKQQRAYATLYANNADYFEGDKRKDIFEKNIKKMATYEKGLRAVAGEAIRTIDAMERAETKITGTDYTSGGGAGAKNPWGQVKEADSTDYADMTAEQIVQRRKQMAKFVNALQTDTDVQTVLSEDAALRKAIENGMSSDMRTVIEWYNTERLKIQEELKKRHLTNEGAWRDEKDPKSRKPKFPESDYALAELDRYYSRRKEELEKARIEENMTEELYNREAELLEQEHLERRSTLRRTFTADNTKEEREMVKRFREWWKELEKTGDLDNVPWGTVESEWSKALASQIGANNLRAQQDLTTLQEITVKHMNRIADIIAKERPYDSITANLRDNLTKMDILFADYQKNGPTEDTSVLVKAGTERLQFLLGEAENAYTSTVEDVLRRMGEAGMTAWAEEIRKSPAMKNALMAQLQTAYDEIQNAIKKEASLIKKQTDIWWNDIAKGETQSRKGGFEKRLSDIGLLSDNVKRANSLIGAGAASERVADKLAIKQMQIRLQMQQVYYDRMRQMWADRIASLRAQGKEIDAQHAEMSRNLSLSEEQKKLDEQRVAIANQLEESNNRLYTELKSWGDLIASSLQGVFEASHAGDAEYYNELAKLNLTGKGGPGAGTYVVIDNAGTSGATAHYEHLSEREALERHHEIERQNAQAEAWKKVMDDINMKMSETITDQMNAMLQNASVDANTDAVNANTAALSALTEQISQGQSASTTPGGDVQMVDEDGQPMARAAMKRMGLPVDDNPYDYTQGDGSVSSAVQVKMAADDAYTQKVIENAEKRQKVENDNDKKMTASAQSAFAKMSQAANLYGIAYQAMSNDNMSATQKFGMIAIQAAGNAAITALTANMSQATGDAAINSASVWGKLWNQLGWWAIPVYALFTGTLGGLMGLAASKIAKSKSEIASVTGASNSVASGRLTTGMLTYAEGNVNEFTDPATLTPGRQYNVDGDNGKTYRARYMGKGAKTHITHGPEFHLVGEEGSEAIIDAHTTRNIQMNEPEVWRVIQTLYNGGSLRHTRRRGRGVSTFADGNIDDFDEMGATGDIGGLNTADMEAMRLSLDRNSAVQEALLERLSQPIQAKFDVYGKGGLVDSYDTGKKTVNRYGQRF